MRQISALRTTVLLLVVLLVLAAAGFVALLYCTMAPGASFAGPLPPLSAAETALVSELRRDVTALAGNIGERRPPLPDALQQAQEYLTEELSRSAESVAVPVETEVLHDTHGTPANLVLTLPGAVPGPIVLVGAHYDSALGTPGANDNASGVAAALALARRVAKQRTHLPVRFVLFANEEPPYFQTKAMGSLQHAARCRQKGELIRVMLSLETMGYYADAAGSQRYPAPLSAFYPDQGDFIAFVANLQSRAELHEALTSFRNHARFPSEGAALPDALPGVAWSDHWAFWQYSYPALMVTDTAPFRDPNYHEATDVIANLDFERFARVVAGLEHVVLSLAAE